MSNIHMIPKGIANPGSDAFLQNNENAYACNCTGVGSIGTDVVQENEWKAVRWTEQMESSVYGSFGQAGICFFMKQIMIAGIRFYQKYLSPLKTTRCPYIPTCSAYGLEAVQKYGAWKGGWMALWRIMRCNPFSHGGYDPVP